MFSFNDIAKLFGKIDEKTLFNMGLRFVPDEYKGIALAVPHAIKGATNIQEAVVLASQSKLVKELGIQNSPLFHKVYNATQEELPQMIEEWVNYILQGSAKKTAW